MRTLFLMLIASLSCVGVVAAEANQAQAGTQIAAAPKPCLAVKDAGSHAFRNIMLAGIAGALISKKQYQVVDAVNYPATIGQKFHGGDLQTLQIGGTRVVILAKNYSADDLHKACRQD